jgi:MtN3 and saliva related transmembrane protein
MIITEIIGYLAGILVAITMIPQIKMSLKTKSVKGISTAMLVIFFSSMLFWTIYGFLIINYPLIITNGFATIISGIQVYIKFKYD